jgi:hypothetical protein
MKDLAVHVSDIRQIAPVSSGASAVSPLLALFNVASIQAGVAGKL